MAEELRNSNIPYLVYGEIPDMKPHILAETWSEIPHDVLYITYWLWELWSPFISLIWPGMKCAYDSVNVTTMFRQ